MKLVFQSCLTIILLTACTSNSSWTLLQQKNLESWMIGVNSNFTKLWTGKPYLEKVTEFDIQSFSDIQSKATELPKGDGLSEFCSGSSIAFSASNNIYEHQDTTNSWGRIYQSSHLLRRCKLALDGSIYFVEGDHIISKLKDGTITSKTFNIGNIRDILIGENNSLSVLSDNNKIYTAAGSTWEEVLDLYTLGIPDSYSIFRTALETIWIVSSNGVYTWTPSDDQKGAHLVVFSQNFNLVVNIYEVPSNDKVYIVTGNGVFEVDNNICQEIIMPINAKRNYSSALVPNKNILFVSTDKGLYYLNLLDTNYKSIETTTSSSGCTR